MFSTIDAFIDIHIECILNPDLSWIKEFSALDRQISSRFEDLEKTVAIVLEQFPGLFDSYFDKFKALLTSESVDNLLRNSAELSGWEKQEILFDLQAEFHRFCAMPMCGHSIICLEQAKAK